MSSGRKDRSYYLHLAEQSISSAPFTKEREAAFRSYLRLAEVATSSSDKARTLPPEFRNWLIHGGKTEFRDMTSGGGSFPGSTGVPVPLEFEATVVEALRAVDDLWNPDVVTLYETPRGTAWQAPCADDSQEEAQPVVEGSKSTANDITLGQLSLPKTATYRSGGILVSSELLQESAIDFPQFLSKMFATRFQRRIGRTVLVPALVAAATVVRTATGATAASQAPGDGTNSVSSDDLACALGQLDEAYAAESSWVMTRGTLSAIYGLRSSTGSLVFKAHNDPDTSQPILLGRPVRLCPSMQALGHANVPVILGALKRLVIRVVTGGVSLLRSEQLYAQNSQIFFEGYLRANAGIAFTASNPSTPSPFVAIANS